MNTSENINSLIINWYIKNKRDLPWRKTNNPYHIWLSEIILQQTRVQQGLAYYLKFVRNYPLVSNLAQASEQQVLSDWQGLGYYSRARNLHKAAKIIHEDFEGIFPDQYSEIIKLPGIGDYTASAIASFAFNENQAVLDGNVFRVLSRLFNWSTPIDSTQGKKEFRQLAQDFLVENNPAEHNQAMMEFGATLCTPKNPNCEECPVLIHCEGYNMNVHLQLPVKEKKTKVRNRQMNFLFLENQGEILVEKRSKKDIWQHLYQFPCIDEILVEESELKIMFEKEVGRSLLDFHRTKNLTHLLSHQKLNIDIFTATLANPTIQFPYEWVKTEDLEQFPFPRPLVDFLQEQLSLKV